MIIPFILLAAESSSVIALRTMKLMSGGGAAAEEARLMISELDAAFEATASLFAGASGDEIIHRYRHHVAVNARRLSNC
jgi:hypothetical protein